MELSLDGLARNEGSVRKGLPWLIAIVLSIAIAYLYWHQVETEKVQSNKVKALQEKVIAQDAAFHQLQLATPAQDAKLGSNNASDPAKNLNAKITMLELKIKSLESNIQEVEFGSEATKSDFTNRLATLEAEDVNNRFAGIQNQIIDLRNDLTGLKQLVK